jgi:hypothetical protein
VCLEPHSLVKYFLLRVLDRFGLSGSSWPLVALFREGGCSSRKSFAAEQSSSKVDFIDSLQQIALNLERKCCCFSHWQLLHSAILRSYSGWVRYSIQWIKSVADCFDFGSFCYCSKLRFLHFVNSEWLPFGSGCTSLGCLMNSLSDGCPVALWVLVQESDSEHEFCPKCANAL